MTPVKARKALGKLRWDYDGAWEAVITQGPRKGTKATCEVANMTAEKWELVSKLHEYTVEFETATFQDKKFAAKHYLQLHLQREHPDNS